MNILIKAWQFLAPRKLVTFFRFLTEPKSYRIRRRSVLDYYKKSDKQVLTKEIKEAVQFLKFHKFTPYPYKWTLKYEHLIPEVFFDKAANRFFIYLGGKKLYFQENFTKEQAIWGTRSLLKEQDPQSPHLYLTKDFQIEPGSIVVDAGVAEGNFAISVVEKAKKLYLIECDPKWIEALKITFEPWKDKVIFVEKYLSDTDDSTSITIDSLLQPDEKEKYFIKMDIEGFEKKALAGMSKLMTISKNIKMDICTYHHHNDLKDIEEIINSYGFKWHVSDGYILFFQPGEEPDFRKALIRAEKGSNLV